MKILDGLTQAQFTVTSKKGKVQNYKVRYFKNQVNLLMTFRSPQRGNLLKILYDQLGDQIYAYEVNAKQLKEKKGTGRFDPILGSGFYYTDMVHMPFAENYVSKIKGTAKLEGKNLLKLESIPLIQSKYSKVNFWVDHNKKYKIVRIDYFEISGILWKTMNLEYGKLPSKQKKKTLSVYSPIKYEIFDLKKNTISSLEFLLNNQMVKIHKSLFDKENIEK